MEAASSEAERLGMVQLLDQSGRRRTHPDYDDGLDDAAIGLMYRDMLLSRRFDTEAVALQRQGELGLWVSMLGQEGAQVGAARAMQPQDVAFPSHREHAVAWCRGVDMLALLGLFRGTNLCGYNPFEHNFTSYTLVNGAQSLHAVGYAMGVVRDGLVGTGDESRDVATMVFFGDGASSQGDVNESFVWAAAQGLPLVFFCQNNQWAISEPVSVSSQVPLFHRARGFGFPGVRVDGNDPLATFAVTRKALEDARSGDGPTLIEAYTYRMNPHTTSDDPTRYRASAEVEFWAERDPVDRVRKYLAEVAEYDQEFFDAVDAEAEVLAEHIRTGCRSLPNPSPASLFDNVFADLPSDLVDQRVALETFVASLEDTHG